MGFAKPLGSSVSPCLRGEANQLRHCPAQALLFPPFACYPSHRHRQPLRAQGELLLATQTSTAALFSPIQHVRWFSRPRLIVWFWLGAILTVVVMAGPHPLDGMPGCCGPFSPLTRLPILCGRDCNPARVSPAPGLQPAERPPLVYVYSPMTRLCCACWQRFLPGSWACSIGRRSQPGPCFNSGRIPDGRGTRTPLLALCCPPSPFSRTDH